MTKQLLFYERAVPVSVQRHGTWSMETRSDFRFAGHSSTVPLAAVEFPAAAVEYAIVFTGTGDDIQPSVILGLEADENRYVDEQGKWNAGYIPAFVRRYPFVFSSSEDGSKFTLCIDEEFGGWNQGDRGQRLFDADGEGTEYFKSMLKFVRDYQRESNRTQTFCGKLRDLGLLEPMTARFKLPSGQKAQLTGFMAIDREKLKALSGDELAELAKTGELELMYVHLQSMRNLAGMLQRSTGNEDESEALPDAMEIVTDGPLH